MMYRWLPATLVILGALSACDTGTISAADPASAASRDIQSDDSGLTFDGWRTYVDIPAPAALATSETLTVEATVRGSAFGSGNWESPVVSWHGNASGWELRVGEAIPRFMVTTDRIHQYAEPGDPARAQRLTPNKWVHLAGVYDNSSISLYVDGKLTYQTRRIDGRLSPYTGSINIGRNPGFPDRFFKGEIKQVSIWTKARTQTEIAADLATPPADGPREGLLGHWDLAKVGSDGTIKNLAGSTDGKLVSRR